MSKEELKKLASKFESALDKSAQQEESWDRDHYIGKIHSLLGGGLGEYYKYCLASKNNEMNTDVKTWQEEGEYYSGSKLDEYLCHSVRGFKNYDKTWESIISILSGEEQSIREWATNKLLGYGTGNTYPKPLDDSDYQKFLDMANKTYSDAKTRDFKFK